MTTQRPPRTGAARPAGEDVDKPGQRAGVLVESPTRAHRSARGSSWWPWTLPSVMSVLVVTTSVPSIITPDGYAYLMGARYMGQPEMADYFPWYREPLYSTILRGVGLGVGRADVWLLAVQALALGVGSTLVAHAFLRGARRWLIVGVACFIAVNPVMLGYAGAVLQQVWFYLALATYAWVAAWAWRARLSRAWLPIAVCIPLIAFWAQLGQQMIYPGAPLGAMAGFALGSKLFLRGAEKAAPRNRGSLVARFGAVVALGVLLGGIFTLWGSVALKPYEHVKAEKIAQRGPNALYLTSLNLSVSGVADTFVLTDPAAFLGRVPRVTRSILSLGPATWREGAPQEDDSIIGHAFSSDALRCGVGVPPGAGVDVRLGGAWLQQTCRSELGFAIIGPLQPLGRGLVAASSMLLLVSPVVLLLLRRWDLLLLLMFPFTFLALYVATFAGLDRYGMPLYPFGIAAACAAALAIHQRWRSRSSALVP